MDTDGRLVSVIVLFVCDCTHLREPLIVELLFKPSLGFSTSYTEKRMPLTLSVAPINLDGDVVSAR